MFPIESRQQAELQFLKPRRGRAANQIRDRLWTGNDTRALMASRQKIGTPNLAAGVRQLRREHDKRGQVLVHRAEAVADPRADAGPSERDRTGMNAEPGLKMLVVVPAHRADH